MGGLAQLEERVVSNDEAPGSKPGFSNFFFDAIGCYFEGKKHIEKKKQNCGSMV